MWWMCRRKRNSSATNGRPALISARDENTTYGRRAELTYISERKAHSAAIATYQASVAHFVMYRTTVDISLGSSLRVIIK